MTKFILHQNKPSININYILLKEKCENTCMMMQEFDSNFGISNYINKILNLINIFKYYE
jgi:hypothetical protein